MNYNFILRRNVCVVVSPGRGRHKAIVLTCYGGNFSDLRGSGFRGSDRALEKNVTGLIFAISRVSAVQT